MKAHASRNKARETSNTLGSRSRRLTNISRAAVAFGLGCNHVREYLLSPLGSNDLSRLQSALSESPETNWRRKPATESYVRSLLGYRLWHYTQFGFGVMAVESPSGAFVGQAGLQVMDAEADLIEVVIFLRPQYVGRGVGKLLLGEIVDRARWAGIESLFAAIRDENVRAQHFFEGAGFTLVDQGVHFDQECGIWERRLSEQPDSG